MDPPPIKEETIGIDGEIKEATVPLAGASFRKEPATVVLVRFHKIEAQIDRWFTPNAPITS